MDTWIGLDLGRMVDHTALAVTRRSLVLTAGKPSRDHRGQTMFRYEVPQVKQYLKGTPYPEIITHIRDVVLPQPWIGANPRLVVDAGGVGGGIVDMLIDARLPVELIALTITGGAAVSRHRWPRSRVRHWHVAKAELVSVVQSVFQAGRIVIYPMPADKDTGRDHAATLRAELRGFTVRQSKAANEIYSAREGEHDDVLLATALPIFLGQQSRDYPYATAPLPASASPEVAALEAERQTEIRALKDDEKAREERSLAERQERDRQRQANPFDPSWRWTRRG